MAIEIKVDLAPAMRHFSAVQARIEAEVLDALDACAALVANDAKAGHPKVKDTSTKGASFTGVVRGQFLRAAEDAFRMANPDGTLRWLTRTGGTRESILPIKAVKDGTRMYSKVVSGLAHSDRLEFGSVKTRPFPFMRPALEKNAAEISRRLERAVRRGMTR